MMTSASELIMMIHEQDRMIENIERQLYHLKEQSRLIRNKLCENDREEDKVYQRPIIEPFLSDEEIKKLKGSSPVPSFVPKAVAYNTGFGFENKQPITEPFLSDEEIQKLNASPPLPTLTTGEEAYNARFGFGFKNIKKIKKEG